MKKITMMAIIVVLLSRIFVILSSLAIIDAPISESGLGFIFGTASSSAYQYEGAENVGGRGPTIWDNSTHKYPDLLRHYNEDVFVFNTSFVYWYGDAGFPLANFQSVVGDVEISSSLSSANALWRLVGLVSSVVGLLCYALSPSFNRLIGRWNVLKFSLYGVFSLAILTTMLFTKKFSPSTRYAHIKTYTSFVVLMIISVYSFYYDKALNGKPEILSIVSNAAFALMSLSLSKLIKFGFEIGIFAYFLGCLVVQLWTINWMLILVAVLFGCPLFVMHSSSDSQEDFDNRDQIIDESSGSDPEVGNAGQQDVGNESKVIIDSYPDSQEELSCEGQVIHSSSDTIPEVASSGDDQQLDIILEANSVSVVES